MVLALPSIVICLASRQSCEMRNTKENNKDKLKKEYKITGDSSSPGSFRLRINSVQTATNRIATITVAIRIILTLDVLIFDCIIEKINYASLLPLSPINHCSLFLNKTLNVVSEP